MIQNSVQVRRTDHIDLFPEWQRYRVPPEVDSIGIPAHLPRVFTLVSQVMWGSNDWINIDPWT